MGNGSGLFALCTLDGKFCHCPGRRACEKAQGLSLIKSREQVCSAFDFETRGNWASEMFPDAHKRI